MQVAGQRGLATAAQDSGDTTVSFAITQFRDLLSKNILAAISTKDVAIYKHPEGELYEKGRSNLVLCLCVVFLMFNLKNNLLIYTLVETEYVPKLREDKKPAAASKEHRKRGERGLYSKADLAYEEKLRKDLEEKKKKEDAAAAAKPKFTEAELKVLAKESQTRANVAQVRANISNTLKVCSLFASFTFSTPYSFVCLLFIYIIRRALLICAYRAYEQLRLPTRRSAMVT